MARAAAKIAGQCDVVVATDDERIADHAREIGVDAAMTATDINSGSARAYAAAQQRGGGANIVINLQGDAPFIPPAIVANLVTTLRMSQADVATPVYRLDWERMDRLRKHKTTAPFSGTTCIRAADGRALWFSKTILPALRDEASLRDAAPLSPVWQHLGLYGYRLAALEWFASAAPGYYEILEGLEQLRFLENDRAIVTVEVDPPSHAMAGIDTPADVALAEEAIARLGDPYPA